MAFYSSYKQPLLLPVPALSFCLHHCWNSRNLSASLFQSFPLPFTDVLYLNKKWLFFQVYRQMFSGEPPMQAAQAHSWARRQQGCYKLAGACCPVTFPSTSHSCVLRGSTSRGSRGYYHYVYVSGRVNYTSDGRRGRKRECACSNPLLPKAVCECICEWDLEWMLLGLFVNMSVQMHWLLHR